MKVLDAVFNINNDGKLTLLEMNMQFKRSLMKSCCCSSSNTVISLSAFIWSTWDVYFYLVYELIKGQIAKFFVLTGLAAISKKLGNLETTSSPRRVKSLRLILRLFLVVSTGALFFKLCEKENRGINQELSNTDDDEKQSSFSWVEAYYFAMVTASSVGYGDIYPVTQTGKFFSIFYLVGSTVIVAGVLGEVIELFVEDTVEASVIAGIIDSDVYSYRCDISHDYHISETDFILFKMHQLHKVDTDLKRRLIDKFTELDIFKSNSLKIGFEIPNRKQVKKLKEQLGEKVKLKIKAEGRSPLAVADKDMDELESIKLLMNMWSIKQETIADKVADKYGIKQEPKNDRLRLKEMSKVCVTAIQDSWEEMEREKTDKKRAKKEATAKATMRAACRKDKSKTKKPDGTGRLVIRTNSIDIEPNKSPQIGQRI